MSSFQWQIAGGVPLVFGAGRGLGQSLSSSAINTLYDLSSWDLITPLDDDADTFADQIDQGTDLNNFQRTGVFEREVDRYRFIVDSTDPTTSGSSFPRCEFKEPSPTRPWNEESQDKIFCQLQGMLEGGSPVSGIQTVISQSWTQAGGDDFQITVQSGAASGTTGDVRIRYYPTEADAIASTNQQSITIGSNILAVDAQGVHDPILVTVTRSATLVSVTVEVYGNGIALPATNTINWDTDTGGGTAWSRTSSDSDWRWQRGNYLQSNQVSPVITCTLDHYSGTFAGPMVVPSDDIVEWGDADGVGTAPIPLPAGATSITNAGGTNLVVSGSNVQPAGAVSAGTVTFDNGTQWTVQVVTNGTTVDNWTDLKSELTGTRAYGDTILLRTGDYNVLQADERQTRSVPSGTYTFGSSHVTVRASRGNTADIHRLELGGSGWQGFKFFGDANHNITFNTQQNIEPATTYPSNQFGAIWLDGGCPDLTFDGVNFQFGGSTNTAYKMNGSEGFIGSGIRLNGTQSNHRLRVENCYFDGCRNAISTIRGDDIVITSNEIHRAGEDDIQQHSGPRYQFTNNLLTDKVSIHARKDIVTIRTTGSDTVIETTAAMPSGSGIENIVIVGAGGLSNSFLHEQFNYNNDFDRNNMNADITQPGANGSVRLTNVQITGYTSGGQLYHKTAHADAHQFGPQNAVSSSALDDYVISGNTILIGEGSYGFNTRQGGIWANNSPGLQRTNWEVIGNCIEHTGLNCIHIRNMVNGKVWSNVAIRRQGYITAGGISVSELDITGDSNTSVYDNIANQYSLGGNSGPEANNVTLATTQVAYEGEFDDPPIAADFWGITTTPSETLTTRDNYEPAAGATANAGLANWDSSTNTYTGSRT